MSCPGHTLLTYLKILSFAMIFHTYFVLLKYCSIKMSNTPLSEYFQHVVILKNNGDMSEEAASSQSGWYSRYVQMRTMKIRLEEALAEQQRYSKELKEKCKSMQIQHLNETLSQAQKIETLKNELQRALATNRKIQAKLKSYRIPTGVPMNLHENMSTQNAYVVGASQSV